MLKNNKGVTLISLIVTIIVLIILATVATVSGVGAVNYIKFNNAKSQFQTMQSNVNSWYEESKNNTEILNYGADLTDADSSTVSKTLNGIDSTGFRYFSADYITNSLDIDGVSYDFLINISSSTVLLYGGIEYEDKTYYSAEDFGIDVVEYEELSGTITFDTVVEDENIIVYNIQFPDDINISKYDVQYKMEGDKYWTTLTSDKKNVYKYEDNDGNTVTDNNAWYIESLNIIDDDIPYIDGDVFYIKVVTKSENVASEEVEVNNTYVGRTVNEKKQLKDREEKIIWVPEGFTITEDSIRVGLDKNGDGKDDVLIRNGIVVEAPDGSEFVWVPVEEINSMATATSGTDTKGRTNYQGKLYDFSSTDGNYTATEKTSYGQGTTSYREPSLVTGNNADTYAVLDSIAGTAYDASSDYYNTILGYSSAKDFGKDMQEDFNEMIESVKDNKGFYVGRYETSLSSSGNAQSKSGETSATSVDDSTYMWYGLYQKEKEYSEKNSLTEVVGSSMIWGSQYDQMMIWMQKNGIDVRSTTPTNLEGVTTSKNGGSTTGTVETDKLNNIYDLLGNRFEWTLEADSTYRRIRGGIYNRSISPSSRNIGYPDSANADLGSRLALYVK